jgi:predicted membrane-bound spermidine synthase
MQRAATHTMQEPQPVVAARPWAMGLALAYVVAVLVLFVLAGRIMGLQCENFGCMGIGVAWMAWTAIYVFVLGWGSLLGRWLPARNTFLRLARVTRLAQLLSGLVLLAMWLLR